MKWIIACLLALLLGVPQAHATVFWDDELEAGTGSPYNNLVTLNGGNPCQGSVDSFDNINKISGLSSLRLPFPGAAYRQTCGGFADRTFTPTQDLWTRYYIRLSPGFVVDVLAGTKLIRHDQTNTFNNWWVMKFGDSTIRVELQNYPTVGSTIQFNPNTGNGTLPTDGTWHCVETRLKNSTLNNADGIIEAYKDGVRFMNYTNIANISTENGNNGIAYNSARMFRQDGGGIDPPNGTTGEINYDRFAVGDERIGCLGSDATLPVVSMTAPTNGASVGGTAVTLVATASDNVGVVGVQFLLEGANLGTEDLTAPYSITWDSTGVTGTHSLSARARDAAGNTATATQVTVTVNGGGDTTNPTVSMTAPANGATVSGTAVTVSANAGDNVGVAGVQFLLDGVNLSAEDTASPYAIAWDTTGVSVGSHTLSARARDATGNTATSSAISVTIPSHAALSHVATLSTDRLGANITFSGSSYGLRYWAGNATSTLTIPVTDLNGLGGVTTYRLNVGIPATTTFFCSASKDVNGIWENDVDVNSYICTGVDLAPPAPPTGLRGD